MVDFFSSLSVTSLVGAFAFLALIVPLVLHLLSRNPGRHVIVGSLSLIKHAQTQSVTEIRLTDLLLLILRLLVLALLALYLMGLVLEGTRPSLDSKAQAFVTPAWQQTMGADAFSALADTFERENITLLDTPGSLQALVRAGENAQATAAPHLYRTNLLADWRLLAGLPLGGVQVSEQKLSDTATKALQQTAPHTLHLTLLPPGAADKGAAAKDAATKDTADIMALAARISADQTLQITASLANPHSTDGNTAVGSNRPSTNTESADTESNASESLTAPNSSHTSTAPHADLHLALWLSSAQPTPADLASLPPHVPVLNIAAEPTLTFAQEAATWPFYPYTRFAVFQLADLPPANTASPSTVLWRSDISGAPLLSVRSLAGRSVYRLHVALAPSASTLLDQPTALTALSETFAAIAASTRQPTSLTGPEDAGPRYARPERASTKTGPLDLAGADIQSRWQERYLHAAVTLSPNAASAAPEGSQPSAASPSSTGQQPAERAHSREEAHAVRAHTLRAHTLGPWLLVCAIILWGIERLVSEGRRRRA